MYNIKIADTPQEKIPFVFKQVNNASLEAVTTDMGKKVVKIQGTSNNLKLDDRIQEGSILRLQE